MSPRMRLGLICVAVTALISACAAPPPSRAKPQSGVTQKAATFHRVTAAIRAIPASMVQQKTQRSVGSIRGLDAVEELVHAGLTFLNNDGSPAPQLAAAVPTVENGLWKIFPDGRMETTWRIRETARWHDGTQITSEDLAFTAAVEQDKEVGIPPYPAYESIESITAPDPRTVTVAWKRPFIEADGMFGYRVAGLPMPRHLLEKAFAEDKAGFTGLSYWTTDFVGAGAYKIKDWVRDSHVVLQANDEYVLGRPKIDEIEVKFIPDPTTLMANVLAGVELTLGKTISLDQALQLRDQWKDGRMLTKPQAWTPINVQFINPNPTIVTDYRFRRAMIQAIDRQQLSDTVWSGQSNVAHSYVLQGIPFYNLVEPSIVKYEYDPRAAAQAIEGLGYTKRADGFFSDASGQRLSVSIYSTVQNDIHPKTTAAVADYWQRLGVEVEQVLIPIQRAQDREYRAQFPGFELIENANSISSSDIRRFHSSSTPLPENRFQVTGNNSRYRNPELDSFIDRYITTIPMPERMQALAGILHHQTENLTQLPLFHGVDPTMVANRILNVTARADRWTQAWNVQEWAVKD